MSIGDRFVLFLREKKISQKEFCDMTGYGQQSLSKFIQGKTTNPGVQLFILVAEHFPELNIKWLMIEEGKMWNEDFTPSGKKKSEVSIPAGNVVVMGKGSNNELLRELLETKDKLIEMQQHRIESLEKQLGKKS